MEILTSVRRLCISFKSLVNDFVYSFGRAALLLLVEVQNHTVLLRERRRIRVNVKDHIPRGSGSVVAIATGYGLDGPGIEFRWGRDFPHLSRPALGPIQPPVQLIPGRSRG